jgi:RNA recognition motif-containing protein
MNNGQTRSTSPPVRGGSRERKYEDVKRRESKEGRKHNSRSRSQSPRDDDTNPDNGDTLYISNLSKRIDNDRIRDKFSKYGKVLDINIVRDPFTRDCRGFGFVKFSNFNEANEAKAGLDNTDLEGRILKVEKAKRVKGHAPTPGKYLGHYRSNHGNGNGNGGGKRPSSPNSRGRYERDLRKREKSRSRSGGRGGGGGRGGRSRSRSKSKDRRRERSGSFSRNRVRGAGRDRSKERERHRSRSPGDRNRDRRR